MAASIASRMFGERDLSLFPKAINMKGLVMIEFEKQIEESLAAYDAEIIDRSDRIHQAEVELDALVRRVSDLQAENVRLTDLHKREAAIAKRSAEVDTFLSSVARELHASCSARGFLGIAIGGAELRKRIEAIAGSIEARLSKRPPT